MLQELLLFTLAILPIIFLGYYVYSKDNEKEPKKILIKLFIGGLIAAFLTVLITLILKKIFPYFSNDSRYYSNIGIFIYSFCIVALVEELSKFLMTYIISYKAKEFDQLYDMIVYAVFVSLGFAWIENILYVFSGGVTVALLRIFLAVPTHVSVGIFMGYYLSFAKLADINKKLYLKRKYIIYSIIIPTIFHGIYDYLLYSGNYLYLYIYLLFICFLYINAYKRIKLVSNMRTNLVKNYCPCCGHKTMNNKFCKKCGRLLN